MLILSKFLYHIKPFSRINGMLSGTKRFLFFLLLFNLLANSNLLAQQFKNEQELRKEADRLFDEDEFTKAYNLFTQLVSLYPKDAELNYKLGVCMLYSEPDKKKCFSYLKLAALNTKEAPKDALFYYGKAFHINYMFDEAINYYDQYKRVASPNQIKKLQVDKEIKACNNGKRLLATMSELIVMSKKQLNEADYFRSYDLSTIGGKLLVKPDQFRTNYDKKKKEKSVIYIPKSGDKIYFSSLGEDGSTGRDIYYSTKVSPDKFSKPQKLPTINTDLDEDYPFLHPDGKTLYFSSKGFNSMGGYDIFKSTYDEATNTWSQPVNLEFPVNSPDDDYLFVTDSSEKYAYFSTGRQSPPGKIDVLKVKTERVPMTIAFIKGTVLKESAAQSVKSKITVKNMDNGKVVGVFQAKDNGDYTMEVPNGGKLLFTVETPGIPVQSDKVILPMATSFSPFKQSISYDNKVLKITNYFDSPPDDNSYLQYLELIEKKAKLEVNENDVKTATVSEPLAGGDKDLKAVTTTYPTVTSPKTETTKSNDENVAIKSANTTTTASKPNYSNDQLVNIAKEDAKEAKEEAQKMSQDAADANELGEQKKIEADKLSKQAEEALGFANSLSDPIKKENALEEANKLKADAEDAAKISSTLLNYAKALNNDAVSKQKEAALNEQFAKELEAVAKNKNNKESLNKLSELQKQIDAVNQEKKQSEIAYNQIKSDYDQKQTEITKAEQKSNAIKNEISEINKEISINETEINNTKDKSLKKSLAAQVTELKTDLDKKQSELTANQKEIEKLKEAANAVETEMYLANQVKTTDSKTAVATAITTTTAPVSTTSTAISNNTITATTATSGTAITKTNPVENLATKYNEKMSPVQGNESKESLQSTNVILSDYNKEITSLIVADNNKLKTAKTEAEKTAIKNEIAELQKQKDSNIKQIAANTTKIKEQETLVAAETKTTSAATPTAITSDKTVTAVPTTAPITTIQFDGKNDLNQLNSLKTNINTTNNPAFAYNDYKDSNSANLKKDAENKLKTTENTKQELENAISKAEESIKTNTATTVSGNKDAVYAQGDALAAKAKETRTLANSKTGAEKEKLLAQAKQYDADANRKYLEASDISKKQNKFNIDLNNQNITELVNQATYFNKNTPENTANLDAAQKLNSEAQNYIKQATAMRDEANGLGSDAAKLGTISNAEEKEAEAMAKQEQAIKILMKSNPGYTLKKAEFNENPNAIALNNVTQKFNQLNKEKLDAYMTLSKANQGEYKTQINKLNQNPAIKNNSNPEAVSLKKQAEAANAQAVALISKALTEQDANQKQNSLLEANKKEVEALTLLNQASTALETTPIAATTSTKEPVTKTTEPVTKTETKEPITKTTEPVNTESVAITKTNEPVTKTTEPVKTVTTTTAKSENKEPITKTTESVKTETVSIAKTETKEPVNKTTEPVKTETLTTTKTETTEPITKSTEPVKTETLAATKTESKEPVTKTTTEPITKSGTQPVKEVKEVKEPTIASKNSGKPYTTANSATINPEYKLVKDTSVKSIISFIDNNPVAYKNTEATGLKSNAINNLISLADEQSKLDDQVRMTPGSQTGIEETKANINKLNTEADNLDAQASLKRKEAQEKTGPEKEQLVSEIKDLENKSYIIKSKAGELQKELNNAQFTYNTAAINNYLEKAKAADAEELKDAQELLLQVTNAKKQASDMRDEASTITNPAAKLGAYSNAEDKEAEVINKQSEIIRMLRKYDLAYSPAPLVVTSKPEDNMSPELKQKYDVVLMKQSTELENLNRANIMEYETINEQLPVMLNDKQKQNKAQAESLILASKQLTDKANQTQDNKLKKELLKQASRKGQEAIVALNKVYEKDLVAKNTGKPVKEKTATPVKTKTVTEKPVKETTEPVAKTETTTKTEPVVTTKTKAEPKTKTQPATESSSAGTNQVALNVKGLEIKTGNVYSASNPIPIDQKIPDGLVFRVQVGAFKAPIPNNTFKGLTPVNAQTTPNGYLRYTVGNFEKFDEATGVKNDLRKMGYSDAFVVVYYNGQRITVNEAINILQKEGKEVIASSNVSAGIPSDANIAKNIAPAIPKNEYVVVTKELEKTNGLLYTIQIGVYSREITRSQLWKLEPIYTEKLPSGLYRYTAGVYNDDKVITDKRRVVELGIKDAFVSAYYNSKRIPFTEAQKIKTENVNLKMEPENPIIFPSENTGGLPPKATAAAPEEPQPTIQPFKNNVTAAPAPTAENGVKVGDEGISFKVQIGAYRNQVPNEVASKFLNIKTWPVDAKFVNGLYIYTVGNFTDAKFAKQLRDEVVGLGVTDAFISVYQNGKKLYGQEATNYLNR